jgi:YHS domain-containing protein
MKILIPLFSIALLIGISTQIRAAEKSPTTAPSAPSTHPAAPNGAINEFCAVEQDNKIDPTGVTYLYKGQTIGFCCPDCIDEFKKNPEKYMKTLK